MDSLLEEDFVEVFKKASDYVKSEVGKFDNQKLLYLYARFKQANEGPCNTPKPGFFDFQGKQKWESWKKLGDMSKMDAMREYINAVTEFDDDWEEKMDKGEIKPKAGMGVAVSRLCNLDDNLGDSDKTVFDWCKEGDVEQVLQILTNKNNRVDVNEKDDEGMTLLHWGCDRGHLKLVTCLLNHKIDINSQDNDGQTALHYAVSCEHTDVVELLLKKGADVNILDSDHQKPVDLADNEEIRLLLQRRS